MSIEEKHQDKWNSDLFLLSPWFFSELEEHRTTSFFCDSSDALGGGNQSCDRSRVLQAQAKISTCGISQVVSTDIRRKKIATLLTGTPAFLSQRI